MVHGSRATPPDSPKLNSRVGPIEANRGARGSCDLMDRDHGIIDGAGISR